MILVILLKFKKINEFSNSNLELLDFSFVYDYLMIFFYFQDFRDSLLIFYYFHNFDNSIVESHVFDFFLASLMQFIYFHDFFNYPVDF